MMAPRLLVLLFAAGSLISLSDRSLVAGQLPNLVVRLSDGDFEHATQASTGQTTGHW